MAKGIMDFWKQAAADITDTSNILDTSAVLDTTEILDNSALSNLPPVIHAITIIYNMEGNEIDRNLTVPGLNLYMVDEDSYQEFMNANAVIYDKTFSTFLKNMITTFSKNQKDKPQKKILEISTGKIDFEFSGKAKDTAKEFKYRNQKYTIQEVRGDGILTMKVPFENNKLGKLEVEAVCGPWGNGLMANGTYLASGFKNESDPQYWKKWRGIYASADGLIGFKLILNFVGKTNRGDFRIHPVGDGNSATEGCIGLPLKSEASLMYSIFSLILKKGNFKVIVNIDDNNDIQEQVKNGELLKN